MDIDANVIIDNLAVKIAHQAKEIAILQAKLEALKIENENLKQPEAE